MLPENIKVSSRIATEDARVSGMQYTDYCQRTNDDFVAILPPKPEVNGRARMFSAVQFAALCILSDFVIAGVKAPLAAKIARRVMEAHERQPQIEQWAIIATANGNVSTLAYDQADIRAGLISGARLNFALVVDLKTYADRVSAAIADLPTFIGGDDD